MKHTTECIVSGHYCKGECQQPPRLVCGPITPLRSDLYEGKTAKQWHDAWLLEHAGRKQDERERHDFAAHYMRAALNGDDTGEGVLPHDGLELARRNILALRLVCAQARRSAELLRSTSRLRETKVGELTRENAALLEIKSIREKNEEELAAQCKILEARAWKSEAEAKALEGRVKELEADNLELITQRDMHKAAQEAAEDRHARAVAILNAL